MGVFALGWRQVYIFWCLPLVLGIVSALFLRSAPRDDVGVVEGTPDGDRAGATTLLTAGMVMFLAFISVRSMGTAMNQAFMALYLVNSRGFSAATASTLIGLNTLVGIGGSVLGGLFAVRYGEKRWLLATLLLGYTCYSLAILIPGQVTFVILYLGFGFINFMATAANAAIMAKLSPGKQRGLAYALYFLPGSIMGAVAPVLAASIGDVYGLPAIFYAAMFLFFLSVAVLQFGVRLEPST
jgi:FSR family fosmidomycin resistance protein-like MFS transporter